MFLRSAMFACAALVAVATPAVANDAPAAMAQCQEMSFRIYFAPGSATLDQTARETLAVAERQVADCGYAELRVAIGANNPHAAQRAQAIRTAANDRTWDAVHITGRSMMQRANFAGPDYAEVTMSPTRTAPTQTEPFSPPAVGI